MLATADGAVPRSQQQSSEVSDTVSPRGIADAATPSSSASVSLRRKNELSDLQRRLAYLSSAIDNTLQRSDHSSKTGATKNDQKGQRVERSSSPQPSKPKANHINMDVNDNQQHHHPPAPIASFSLAAALAARKKSSSAEVVNNDRDNHREEEKPLFEDKKRAAPLPMTVTSVHQDVDDATEKKERTGLSRSLPTTKEGRRLMSPPSSSGLAITARTQLPPSPAGGDISPAQLLREEADLTRRIATLRKIEEEKRQLVEHQRRLLALDLERRELEEKRRQVSRSRGSNEDNQREEAAVVTDVGVRNSLSPVSATRDTERTVMNMMHSSVSRSPSPIAFTADGASHLSIRSVLRSSSMSGADVRLQCQRLMVEIGVDATVVAGKHKRIQSTLYISNDLTEMLVLPKDTPERHHFPVQRMSTLIYPNGVVQHAWMPRRVHICGVVVGNRARSILIAKGCPYFVDTAAHSRARLYMTVGGEAYSKESTLLVFEFPTRESWIVALLGLHATLWPQGKPALSRGRLLWMYACNTVLQQYWESSEPHESVFHQSKRRSRSAQSRGGASHHDSSVCGSRPGTPQALAVHGSGELLTTPSRRFGVPSTMLGPQAPSPSTSPGPRSRFTVASGGVPMGGLEDNRFNDANNANPLPHPAMASGVNEASWTRTRLAAPQTQQRRTVIGAAEKTPTLSAANNNSSSGRLQYLGATQPPAATVVGTTAAGSPVTRTFFPKSAVPSAGPVATSNRYGAVLRYGY